MANFILQKDSSSSKNISADYILLPILTTLERDALVSVLTGALINNSTSNTIQRYNGGSWVDVVSGVVDLQVATNAGNTTTNDIQITDGVTYQLDLTGTAGNITYTTPGGDQFNIDINEVRISTAAGQTAILTGESLSLTNDDTGFTSQITSSGLTASRNHALPDKTGTIALTSDVNIRAISTKTANYTITLSDYTILVDATAGVVTITLPTAASASGYIFNIKKIDNVNTVTIDADGAELIEDSTTLDLIVRFEVATLQSDGTQWWVI